jgi:hypothetical protein
MSMKNPITTAIVIFIQSIIHTLGFVNKKRAPMLAPSSVAVVASGLALSHHP